MIELNNAKISETYLNSIILRLCEFANGMEFYRIKDLENAVNSYLKTIKYFLANYYNGPLYLFDIKAFAKVFFEDSGLNYNLRTTDVIIGDNGFQPADKSRIPYLVQEILQVYNMNSGGDIPFSFNPVVKELDIYDNEALFHIGFVRIQPFEDGNKRMANLLTVLNFLKYYGITEVLPPIMCIDQREEYFECIRNNDYKRLGAIFRARSQSEKKEFEHLSESSDFGPRLT